MPAAGVPAGGVPVVVVVARGAVVGGGAGIPGAVVAVPGAGASVPGAGASVPGAVAEVAGGRFVVGGVEEFVEPGAGVIGAPGVIDVVAGPGGGRVEELVPKPRRRAKWPAAGAPPEVLDPAVVGGPPEAGGAPASTRPPASRVAAPVEWA